MKYWNSLSDFDEVEFSTLDAFTDHLLSFVRILVFLAIGTTIGLYVSSVYAVHQINSFVDTSIMKGKQ